MSEPWFDVNTFGAWFGIIFGAILGSLGGILGSVSVYLSSKGKGKRFVMSTFLSYIILGIVLLAFGIIANFKGQPFRIWFGPCNAGFLYTVLFSILTFVTQKRYLHAQKMGE